MQWHKLVGQLRGRPKGFLRSWANPQHQRQQWTCRWYKWKRPLMVKLREKEKLLGRVLRWRWLVGRLEHSSKRERNLYIFAASEVLSSDTKEFSLNCSINRKIDLRPGTWRGLRSEVRVLQDRHLWKDNKEVGWRKYVMRVIWTSWWHGYQKRRCVGETSLANGSRR